MFSYFLISISTNLGIGGRYYLIKIFSFVFYSNCLNLHIKAGIADMVASAEAITADSEKYVEQLLQLFRRFSLLVNQVIFHHS